MTHELKPCPFCGGPAAEPDENNHTSCTTISCGSTAYMSASAWNERPSEVGMANEIEEAWAAFGFTSNREVLNLAEQIHVSFAELETEVEVIAASVGQQIDASFSIEALKTALKDVRGSIKNARGAVESNQVADKDVHGTLSRAIRMIDAALQDSPPIIRVEGETQ